MRWTLKLAGGPRRVNHAAVTVGNRVFSFGGYCTGDNYQDYRLPIDVFVLNPHTYRWRAVVTPTGAEDEEDRNQDDNDDYQDYDDEDDHLGMGVANMALQPDGRPVWPYQRYGHTVAARGHLVYLFGGRNDTRPCNKVYCFDTHTYEWSRLAVTGTVPAERDGHSACIIDNCMYVFGGYEETNLRFGRSVYRLNLDTLVWDRPECSGEYPVYRDFHTATAVGQHMYVFGGRSDNTPDWPNQATEYYTNKLFYLDTTTMSWHSPAVTGPLPPGRRSHSTINLDGGLLMFGGFNGRTEKHFNDLWLYSPSECAWRTISPLGAGPDERRRQAMCHVPDGRIFIFGGTSPYDGPPIHFTQEQQNMIPFQDGPSKLIDQNDLYVLDPSPSLKTLAMLAVIKFDLPTDELPRLLQEEKQNMTQVNQISKPLRTMPLG